MTYQQIQDLIVASFWSETLKQEIARRGHIFPPKTLMCIAYKNAESYNERLRLMKMFVEYVPETSEQAALVIQWLEGCLTKLKAAEPGYIFELRIEDREDPENYICADFDTCLEMIDRFYEHYDWLQESESSRYSIVKRKLMHSGDEIDPSLETYCQVGPGKELLWIPTWMTCEYGECEGDCEECEHKCVDCCEDLIPEWIPDLSAVRYRDRNGEICFGCILSAGNDSWEAYIIPTDSSMFDGDLEEAWHSLDHWHVKLPDVEQITPEDLPALHRKNYDTFVSFWKEKYPDQYKEAAQ